MVPQTWRCECHTLSLLCPKSTCEKCGLDLEGHLERRSGQLTTVVGAGRQAKCVPFQNCRGVCWVRSLPGPSTDLGSLLSLQQCPPGRWPGPGPSLGLCIWSDVSETFTDTQGQSTA